MDEDDVLLVMTSLVLFIAIPCVCFHLIRKRHVSRWGLLNWLLSNVGMAYMLLLFAFAEMMD